MEASKGLPTLRVDEQALEHSVRTALAAVVSILLARAIKLPEYYWAPITSFVVMQSTLGATLQISGQRFVGTAIGAVLGALLAPHFGANVLVFAIGILGLGL